MFRFLLHGEIRTIRPRDIVIGAQEYLISAVKYMGRKSEPATISEISETLSPSSPTSGREEKSRPQETEDPVKVEHYQEIRPPSREALAELLKASDEHPMGRLGYKALDEMTDGSPFFAAGTDKISLHKRKQVLAYLSDPSLYAGAAKAAIQAAMLRNEDGKSREIVQHMLAKGIFGMDRLPPNTDAVLTQFDQRFERGVMEKSGRGAWLMTADNEAAKKAFTQFTQDFLQMQLPRIMEAIKSSTPPKSSGSLTADVIKEIMAKEGKKLNKDKLDPKEIQKYFSHPDVKSLAWIFLAGTNISKAVAMGLRSLRMVPFSSAYTKMGEAVLAQLIQNYKHPINIGDIQVALHTEAEKYLKELDIPALQGVLPTDASAIVNKIQDTLRPQLRQITKDIHGHSYTLDDLQKLQRLISAKSEAESTAHIEKLTGDVKKELDHFIDADGRIQARNLQNSPALDAIYADSLEAALDDLAIFRWVKHPVKIGDIEIAANTFVKIDLRSGEAFRTKRQESDKDEKDEKADTSFKQSFHLFSAGPRVCPGSRIAEYIFKAVYVEMMQAIDQALLKAVEKVGKEEKDEDKRTLSPSLGSSSAGS